MWSKQLHNRVTGGKDARRQRSPETMVFKVGCINALNKGFELYSSAQMHRHRAKFNDGGLGNPPYVLGKW